METRQTPRPQISRPLPYSGVSAKKWVVLGAAIAVIVMTGLVVSKFLVTPEGPKENRYQAVFLENGQAFFGTLKNVTGEYLVIENAYRAQSQQLPQDATEEQKQATANNVSLVRVGKEVYGPENAVRIRAEQVVYWQNLEPNSKVSKAIKNDDTEIE